MSNERKILSFDWALKTVLRNKANFDVLEGFLTALLKQDVVVEELLESESNRAEDQAKQNRVDLLVKLASGERVIIEVQYSLEIDFLRRLLFGVSKVITETIEAGQAYENVRKVISVSIVHFEVGFSEKDYVYHGSTVFRGIHSHQLMVKQGVASYVTKSMLDLEKEAPRTFPEYYIIPIKHFKDVVGDDLDEWIYAVKNCVVPDTFKSKNIGRMKEKLNVLDLDAKERRIYEKYLLDRASEEGAARLKIEIAREEGLEKGREEGLEKGREEGLEKGREEGLEKGREEGLEKGREEGLEKGREEGLEKGREEGLAQGREEGLGKGREEGRAEGRQEARVAEQMAIARNLLDCLPDEVIAEKTALTVEQVKDLRRKTNGPGEP